MNQPTAIIERPILMSGQMVVATLEDRKTHTRRVIQIGSPQPEKIVRKNGEWIAVFERSQNLMKPCLYGQPGNRLWVRETLHYCQDCDACQPVALYDVDRQPVLRNSNSANWKWKSKGKLPSIFMPRWASRITLEIANVRVERVQDTSEKDAIAEGIATNWEGDPAEFDAEEHGYWDYSLPEDWDGEGYAPLTAIQSFATLWDRLNADRGFGWSVNPWVWVIEFKRIKP